MRTFVDQVYVRTPWRSRRSTRTGQPRRGPGQLPVLRRPAEQGDGRPLELPVPSGVILGRDLKTIHPVDMHNPAEIQEFVSHSWYKYKAGKDKGLHPTTARPSSITRVRSRRTSTSTSRSSTPGSRRHAGRASRSRSARWPRAAALREGSSADHRAGQHDVEEARGRAARLVLDPRAHGGPDARDQDHRGRHAGLVRPAHRQHPRRRHPDLHEKLWDPATWPRQARGVGFMEAPRGGLAHWIVIENGKIANYQAVVPSTWNAGPRDPQQQRVPTRRRCRTTTSSPIPSSGGDPADDPQLRPCIACAVHLSDEEARSCCSCA